MSLKLSQGILNDLGLLVIRVMVGAALVFLNRQTRQTGADLETPLPDRECAHA